MPAVFLHGVPEVAAIWDPLFKALEHRCARPGLVLAPADDDYDGTLVMSSEVAGRAGAEVAELANVGHWWMMQDPAATALTLEEFWASLA